MADCGTAGTALDQAAMALMGNGTNTARAQKQIGSLLGHVTLAGSAATPLHVSRPVTTLPKGGGGDALLATMSVNSSGRLHQQQQRQQQQAKAVVHQLTPRAISTPTTAGSQMVVMPPHIQHQMGAMHQQQHVLLMMQKHKHDQMMIMQQQHAAQRQAALESAMQQAATDEGVVDTSTEEGNVQGVSIEELSAAWAEAQDDNKNLTEDGNVQGATMEELAAAWAEAQDEYYGLSDLFAGENMEDHVPAYQYVHDISNGNTELPPSRNYIAEGMRHFENGDLVEAIRNFEMELQINDPDNATAWRMLGRCHAENDQDRDAIVCLETAVDRDPYCAESMLALGVSYVNELNHVKALKILKDWITMNPKYAGMEVAHSQQDDLYGDDTQRKEGGNDRDFQELQSLLLQALEFDGSGEDSADVWEALGVAANVSRDFETAIDAFRKAIDARPNDYQLWNKLGATLANSNRSEQALPAYHKAIALKPKYARAWLNLAISHSNLREFDEAARCYLQTLSLNPGAVHCWSYLRVALSCSERWDLIPFAASQNLDAFKEHYDFVTHNTAS